MIRLLHDPTFAAALRGDADQALAGLELTGIERIWLTQATPAAWRTDPERPARVLAALVEEYPLTTHLAPDRAAGFFASAEFHDAVQARGSLARAFGAYLGRDAPDPRVRALAALECAVAEVRRASMPLRMPSGMRLRLTPYARVLRLPSGTLQLAGVLRAHPRMTLGDGEEAVLVLRTPPGSEVTIEELEPELAALLEQADAGTTRDELPSGGVPPRSRARGRPADPRQAALRRFAGWR